MFVFAAFNSAIGPHTLLRLTPAFAYQAGVVLVIALSFVPQTLVAWQEIREAQRLRGHRLRTLADLRPLFVSLLGMGLDRAIQLAESMDARGFGGAMPGTSTTARRERLLVGGGSVLGLMLLLFGLILRSLGADGDWPGLALMAAGSVTLALALHRQGRRVRRSRYRRWQWRRRDTIAAALSRRPPDRRLGTDVAGPPASLLLSLPTLSPRTLASSQSSA